MSESNKKLLKTLILSFIALVGILFIVGINIDAYNVGKQSASLSNLTYFSDFSLPVFDRSAASASDKTFSTEDMKPYKVILFNGWGPWCPSCVKELPYLNQLAKEYESKGLLITGVVAGYTSSPSQNTDAMINSTLKSLDITFPILLADKRFSEAVEPTLNGSYPGSWAVSADGKLIEFVSGTRSVEDWRALFDKWLKEN